jgi:hypothetical protein
MAEIEELCHKLHVLHERLEMCERENKQLISEHGKLVHENKDLVCELERITNENQMLKRELECMFEKLRMLESQSASMYEPAPFSRVKPYDSDWSGASPTPENERKKGGKKTSI